MPSKVNYRKNVLKALFDIKPVDSQGILDIGRIRKIQKVLNLRSLESPLGKIPRVLETVPRDNSFPTKEEILAELEKFSADESFLENQQEVAEKINLVKKTLVKETPVDRYEEFYFPEAAYQKFPLTPSKKEKKHTFTFKDVFKKNYGKPLAGFLAAGFLVALIIPAASLINRGFGIKDDVLASSLSAYQNLLSAQESLEKADWQAAEQNFISAQADFIEARQELKKVGQLTLGILGKLPGAASISSGDHLIKVGENLARAGQKLSSAVNVFDFDNLFGLIRLPQESSRNVLAVQESALSDSIEISRDDLTEALSNIKTANQELEKIKIDVLPDEIQSGVSSLKEKLPLIEEMLAQSLSYSEALLNFLGHNNPRQYLLIFQNNSEMRATGGFIGTYGLLTLDKGEIKELFIDGIFNADGQLHEKIIPPRPIQKISTAWSMHDANWFADFPTSAHKIAWFYEKTGGPTTDGVISLTPVLIERLLELTGPIALPEYEVVLTADNFVELIQYKVEIDYDKELNRPKEILSDFAPKFIHSLNQLSSQNREEALKIILNCFDEKHILTYFSDPVLEELAVKWGWSGKILPADKDYLSVVSSNINGYKTDKMVNETIDHHSEIQPDGSIIDTLTITRQHKGGQSEYDWWNRVNSNYLRVYLPLGSELISANGQSLEIYQPPIDYQEQGFKTDVLVDKIEKGMVVDKKTGTRVYQENDKTVFGNWVYVSPGETVILKYRYKLPFKIDLTKSADSYSLLVQKQSGSLGSQLSHQLKFPEAWQLSWKYPDEAKQGLGIVEYKNDLKTDKFLGVAFEF
jgi:hypothetical protein